MQIQDVIQALGLLPPDVADRYSEALRHAVRAVGQLAVSAAPDGVSTAYAESPVVAERAFTPAELVLRAADAELRRGVAEPGTAGMPNGATIIDDYIRGPMGLGWNTCDVKTWKPGVPYTRNGQFAWCGAFAARCWAAAGLKLALRQKFLAGTGRLYRWAKSDGGARWVPPRDLQTGDIAVVGTFGSGDGEHITIVNQVSAGEITTYEGNAHGAGVDGRRYEGVVTQSRPFDAPGLPRAKYRVLYGVRPLAEDLA